MQKSINDLPVEVLQLIFYHLRFSVELLLISKKFNSAYSVDELVITTNPTVFQAGIMTILSRFKSLTKLKFQGSSMDLNNHHQIALQFTGSNTLQSIESVSDYIIFGASNCPQLNKLHLPILQAGESFGVSAESDFDHNPRREMMSILDHNPALLDLYIDSAIFDSVNFINLDHGLKRLKLTSLTDETMGQFVDMLQNGVCLKKLMSIAFNLEHSEFPENGLEVIHNSCPLLCDLQIKYAYLPLHFVEDLCLMFPGLKSLKLSHCDITFPTVNWSHVTSHFGYSFPSLHTLSLKNCLLVEEGGFEFCRLGSPHLNLTNLKLFDIGENRPDEDCFQTILLEFPNLKNLRIDLGGSCFPGANQQYTDDIVNGLKSVEILELRFAKLFGDPEKPNGYKQVPIILPNIRELAVWGSYVFPEFLIKPNEARLTKIELQYALSAPNTNTEYNFGRLKSLSVRGITHLAEPICINTVVPFTRNSPLLENLEVHAINHKGSEFNDIILKQIIEGCPRVKSFSTLNFKFRKSSLGLLASNWPLMENLSIKGHSAIDIINSVFEEKILFPFVLNHARLQSLAFGVAGLEFAKQPSEEFISIDPESLEFSRTYPYLKGVSQYELFRCYESYLQKRFTGLSFQIRGPIEDSFHIRGRRITS